MGCKSDMTLCAAYNCHKEGLFERIIDGMSYLFCKEHRDLLNHSRAATILEVISMSKMTVKDLFNRINFDNCGYTENHLYNTLAYLIDSGYLELIDGFLVTIESKNNCSFPGCVSKKRDDSIYCSNHKNMPSPLQVNMVMDFIGSKVRNAREISYGVGLSIKRAKSVLHQLIKFGYVNKEKRGATNYYFCG